MLKNENITKRVLLSSFIGVVTALISSLVLILITALIFNFTSDPASFIPPVGKAILYVTSITGGYFAMLKGEKLASPIISGVVMTVIILLLAMLIGESSNSSLMITVIEYVCIFLAFLAGGFFRHLITSKRPTRKKRRR